MKIFTGPKVEEKWDSLLVELSPGRRAIILLILRR